jgi:two-component system chemotaxis sensor kinase CheA
MINEHLDTVKDLLMLPISTIVEGFPLLVRDLARSQNKEIELIITGSSIEVDKRILEELKDPLIHIIRNCIDHGIKKQKSDIGHSESEKGKIVMKFSSLDGRNLGISISDNGSGIDVKKVLTAAIKEGIVSKEKGTTIDSAEIKNLIFKSGLSTSAMITDISGRGLGLAIVREKVKKLDGNVTVESEPDKGTVFHITLPLTLTTFRGVLVVCTKQLFFIPTNNVVRVIRENSKNIKTVENRDTILLADVVIPIVRLRDILRLTNNENNNEISIPDESNQFLQILVLENDGLQIGFVVEEILDEHQILVKKLGKQLVKVRNISGAAILGSGKVVPVINIKELMNSAVESGRRSVSAKPKTQKEKVYKILVTEDSITSRTLIKEILETAGYIVETAVDGLDGFMKAKNGVFDLIVSDVDMPKMNGFELTTKIRNDSNLSEIPVVLVTALGSKEDKEHGIDVGASAYIVKSSFEKSNLLDVVKKLL